MYRSEPLRVGHVGEFKFKIKFATALSRYDGGSAGYIDISLSRITIFGDSGGFAGPTSNVVCKITGISLGQRFGCQITATAYTNFYTYRIKPIEDLSAGVDYEIVITTQSGNAA